MHDIDRTAFETWGNSYETDEYEYEYESEGGGQFGGPFSEVEEMELAAELLEITEEDELDQFLGSLFKKASKAVGSLVKGPIGRQLGGMLKGIAKQALPVAGAALGSFVPGIGTAIGGAAGSMASNMFELELEGMSQEDQEFEVARRYVRLAGEAAQQAAQAPQNMPPQEAAKQALISAAQQHAPGLLAQAGQQGQNGRRAGGNGHKPRSGRWVRSGNKIVILGA